MPPLTPEEEKRLTDLESRYAAEERPTESTRIIEEIRRLNRRRRTPPEMETVKLPDPKVEVLQAPPPGTPSSFPKPSQGVVNAIYILLTLGGVTGIGIGANKYVPEQPKPLPPEMVTEKQLDVAMGICVKARDDVRELKTDYEAFKPKVGSALRHGTCEQVPGKRKGTYVCGGIILEDVPQNLAVTNESIGDKILWRIR